MDTYVKDNHIFYRASALGSCPRSLLASRRSLDPVTPPHNVLTAFSEGNDAEPRVIELLRSRFTVSNTQREVTCSITPEVSVLGHIDGLIIHNNELKVLEVKAFSPSTLELWRSKGISNFPLYAWQISCYCAGTNRPGAIFAILNKETGKLKLYDVTPPYTLEQIRERVLSIEHYLLSQPGSWPDCEPPGFFCRFPYLHDKPAPTFYKDAELDNLLQRYTKALSGQRQINDLVSNLRGDVLSSVEGLDDSGRTDNFTYTRTPYTTHKLDKDALTDFLEENGRKYNDFTTESPATRLTVKDNDT
jgi:hypothetical protein